MTPALPDSRPGPAAERPASVNQPNAIDQAVLAAKAGSLYAGRRARERIFDEPHLFADPAWDILLDLFAAEGRSRPISVSSSAIASMVSTSTALRWIEMLAARDLVERVPDASDRRRSFVQLTERGRLLVARAVAIA